MELAGNTKTKMALTTGKKADEVKTGKATGDA
jgi:hypothetical protein